MGMGKKLDALLGKGFKTDKFKPLVNVAVSRLAVLQHQRQARWSQAHSDVVQLLEQGHQERALLRVEQVIKEQNMLDAYAMMESYCNLLIERVRLIEDERECPDELKEATSSLLFASSRCGDFPELQEIRAVFISRYGKEFAARAIELRNNCGVNPKIIQKLSTRQPDLENRMKVLKEIAAERSIILQLEGGSSSSNEEKIDASKTSSTSGGARPGESLPMSPQVIDNGDDKFSGSTKTRRKYKDVADAAQAAFESAAYAAAAARAAVELSRSDTHGPDDQGRPKIQQQNSNEPKPKLENKETPSENAVQCTDTTDLKSSMSNSSSDSADDIVEVPIMSTDDVDTTEWLEKEIVLSESDNETHDSGSGMKSGSSPSRPSAAHNDEESNQNVNTENENETHDSGLGMKSSSGLKLKAGSEPSAAHGGERSRHRFSIRKGLFSLRNRGVRGY